VGFAGRACEALVTLPAAIAARIAPATTVVHTTRRGDLTLGFSFMETSSGTVILADGASIT
jgi:hypothetical protein